MAPRAFWKGFLRLSLVTCPVELYPATSQAEKTHFHQINRKTGHRLRQQMVDEETGKVVDTEDKARGYEMRDENQFFKDIASPKIPKDMLQLAGHILDTKAAHFAPGKFKDQYEIALRKLLERKATGKKIEPAAPAAKPGNVINMMDALRQSLGGAKSRGGGSPQRRHSSGHPRRSRKRKAAW